MIPKILNVTWRDKNIVNNPSPLIQNGIKKFIDLNPDWKVNLHDDQELDQYLVDQLNDDYNLISKCHIVEKSDVWRLIKLYNEGGMYMDLDRACNIAMSSIIDENTKWVLPTCMDSDFSHDIMITAPGNPAFLKAIQLNLQRRFEGHNNVYFLGPQTYMHAVTHTLLGEIINTNPGVEVFEKIRQAIYSFPFIKTFREEPPFYTLIYNGESLFNHEVEKRLLYKNEGLKHWTGEW